MSNFTKQPSMQATPRLRIRSLFSFSQPLWLACSFWLLANSIFAQRNLTLSQLTFAPQSYLVNPGRIPLSKYNIGLPLMSGANGAVSSSGFRLGDFRKGSNVEGGPDNPYKKFLDDLDQQNYAQMDVSVNLLDLGFRIGSRNYINVFANETMNALMQYPRPLAEMLFNVGNSKIVNRTYNIQDFQYNVLQYRSIGIGYTRQINKKLSIGFRAKSLMGISQIQTSNDSMRFVSDADDRFFGVLGNLSFMSSGVQNLKPYYGILGNLNFGSLATQALQRNPSNYLQNTGNNGFAFDLGLQLNVNKELDLYASLLNVGSITWKNDVTINPLADDNIEFPTQDLDYFNSEVLEFVDSLGRKATIDTTFKTRLPALLYVGGSYFVTPTTSIDVVLNPRFYLGEIDFGFGVGITTRVNKILQVGGNISSFNKSTINFGAGAALNLGPAQLYLASDNIIPLFAFNSSKTAHFNLGLTFNFGRQTRDERYAELNPKKKAEPKKKEEPKELLASNKPKENDKKSNTPPGTTSRAPVELPPSVSLVGTVFNGISKEQLTGVALEVYIQNADGTEALLTKRTFGNGIILLSLRRENNHRLVLRKNGFSPNETIISTDEMGGQMQLKKEFELNTGVQAPPAITAPVVAEEEEVRVPERELIPERKVETPPVEEKPAPVIATTPPPTSSKPPVSVSTRPGRVIVYRVLENSTIRQSPDERSLELLPVVIGHRLELLEKSNDDWWKVRFRDFVGYLPARILELEE
ncbi:MAG: DUF5723 family protein [Haliscomenobacter sp.]|uniref:DUF5723 family protein n=1 Tax=Haliscomenobacter sp. TaxID=2717303 RepID=UPI0029B9C5F9|nr:DUF5723 family protein [Haliscomenobacter sp.]MDX2071516.1 DUF5723 family protein [Haliscomenobacter sp.]